MLDINPIALYFLTVSSVLVIYVYWYFTNAFKYWKKRNLPYLEPVVPFGNLSKVYYHQQSFGEAFGEAYLELKKRGFKHGGMYALNSPVYIPVDANIIKHIIAGDADNFVDHGFYFDPDDDPLSAHIFNLEGNRWKGIRSQLVHPFTPAKLKNMFADVVMFSEEFQKRLDASIEHYPNDIDILHELFTFTADIISKCGFGLDSKTLKDENKELIKNAKLFVEDQWSIYNNTMNFLFPRNFLKKIKFKLFTKKNTEYVAELFGGLKKHRKQNNILRDDIAEAILKLCEVNKLDRKGNDPLSFNECIAQMWVFFCTNVESSASTLTFAVYELAQHPEYQKKLREEICKALEKHGNKITYEAIQEMTYMDCIIDETLRKYPIFPILTRVCREDYKVPGTDFLMEKNTFVMISNYGIQRDPEYYPDPTRFDPDRFTKENKAKRPFIAHMPFGEGPRICIGKRFGILQSKVGLTTIIKNYEVTLSNKTTPGFKLDPWGLLLRKTGGIWVNLRKIQD